MVNSDDPSTSSSRPEIPLTTMKRLTVSSGAISKAITGAENSHVAFEERRLFQAEREMLGVTSIAATFSVTRGVSSRAYWDR
jgi:hypothetical protein